MSSALRRLRRAAFSLLVLAAASSIGVAQVSQSDTLPRAALAGVVRDAQQRPLPSTRIIATTADHFAVSDDSGRFHLAGLAPGTHDFSVIRLGYAPVSFQASLAANKTLVIAIHLRSVQKLDNVEITANADVRLERTGFFARQRLGIGTFISPQRVDSLSHLPTAGWLLRDVRGLRVDCRAGSCSVRPSRPPYCMYVFVDGVYGRGLGPNALDDAVSINQVHAIEVYERPNMVPTEFQAPLPPKVGTLTTNAGCSAIAVWTKGRAGR